MKLKKINIGLSAFIILFFLSGCSNKDIPLKLSFKAIKMSYVKI